MFTKQCPVCGCVQTYATKKALNSYIKKNKKCRSCVMKGKHLGKKLTEDHKLKISNSSTGENNGFYGKTHTTETRLKLSERKIGKKLSEDHIHKIKKATLGSNNPMYGKSFYDIWVEKHGKDVADDKLKSFKNKISIATSGKKNPMFGKPSPHGSGNGWKGWYNGIFFRSALELSFLINYVDRFNLKIESGEKSEWAIQYTKWDGSVGTYFPDYIINGKYMVEIKPKQLIGTPSVILKRVAAELFCKQNGLKYKIITPLLNEPKILESYNNKKIKFTDIYEKRFREKFALA